MPYWTKGPLLGRGSTAVVSLASDLNSGQLFAVKSASLFNSEFLQYEKSIHCSISSPHIISYLGYDSDDDFYSLFLEYACGGSISDLIRKQKLHESQIRCFAKDILLGLSHLHSMKIAHCDIKCQNILICGDGRAKVADLGCAKYIGADNQNRAKIRGTPMFMAPELARGEEQGLESDVWALGCSIIEMATGRAPWSNVSDAGSLLYRVGFTDDVPEIPNWISDSGKDFLSKCLVKDAANRSAVDELLMHPFLTDADLEIQYKRVTPKSIMDNGVWDSVSESEAVADFGSNRIMDSIGFGDGPDWSWDDRWQTIRKESLFPSVGAVVSTRSELYEVTINDELSGKEGLNVSENRTRDFDDAELLSIDDNNNDIFNPFETDLSVCKFIINCSLTVLIDIQFAFDAGSVSLYNLIIVLVKLYAAPLPILSWFKLSLAALIYSVTVSRIFLLLLNHEQKV